MSQTMKTDVANNFFILPEEILFGPDFIIGDLMCADDLKEIVFGNDDMKVETKSISEMVCWSCFENFEDINAFGAHLFTNPSCFHLHTEQYWYKNPEEKQLCGICNKEMLDESMLKMHCFESEYCRKTFINYFNRTGDVESVLMSNSVSSRECPLTSNPDNKHNSNCTTTRMSEMLKEELTSPASTEIGDNFQYYSKPSKDIKRSLSMMSDHKDISNYVGSTTTHISEMDKKELTSPASTETNYNFLDYSKPSKKVKRSPSMISDYKHNSKNVGCTTTHISETGKKELISPASTETKYNFLDYSKPSEKIKRSPSMISEVIDTVQNMPALTGTHNCLHSVNIEQPFVALQKISTEREFRPCLTSTPDITVERSYSNAEIKPLPLKCLENTDVSQYHDKQFRSVRNKQKHLARNVKCQNLVKPLPTLSCLNCGCIFASHEEKQNHLFISLSCHLFFKNSFLDGEFLTDTLICDNYTLNKNMCPFCLFTVDNGDVISHVLSAMKCRNKLEEAISRYRTPSSKLPTPQNEPKQTAQFTPQCGPEKIAQFTCNFCKRKYTSIRCLRAHKTLKHSNYSKSSHQHKKERQHCSDSEHLFCFFCKKFLTSETDINSHQCRPTRLLSRYWYRKAVWDESEYQCTACGEKFFYRKGELEKHMYSHDKKRSHLFKFLPCSSNQTEMLQVPSLDITNDTSPETCHDDKQETTLETASDESSVEVSVDVLEYEKTGANNILAVSNKNTISEPCSLNKPSGSFVCECCSTEFCLPDVFTAHVMMNSNCLVYYENQENKLPVTVPFCFKCKRNFRSDSESISHQCIGLVSIIYKCALCLKMSNNLNSLRKHEIKKHRVSMESENVETIEPCDGSEAFADDTPVYQCIPCQSTFHNSSDFVEHILQVHE